MRRSSRCYCATVSGLSILGIFRDRGEKTDDCFQCCPFPGEARARPGVSDAHNKVEANWPGLVHANIIKTGDRSYCIIAEWTDMDACIAARPNMIATLNSFRDTLEDLGGGLGVTDPVAGPVALALK